MRDTFFSYVEHERRHGIFQRGSQWADGPEMVTQCPIRPGRRYTYRYNVTGQEGTLWWHAHTSMLRAIVIKPRLGGQGYPFPKPHKEEILGAGSSDVKEQSQTATVIT